MASNLESRTHIHYHRKASVVTHFHTKPFLFPHPYNYQIYIYTHVHTQTVTRAYMHICIYTTLTRRCISKLTLLCFLVNIGRLELAFKTKMLKRWAIMYYWGKVQFYVTSFNKMRQIHILCRNYASAPIYALTSLAEFIF